MEKFQRKRPGITRAELEAEFNATHTWIEYINRLTSMPVGLFTLATFVLSFGFARSRPKVFVGALAAVVLVGVNAWLGKNVVESGLKPGVITLHMALAILLLCVQVYIVFAGGGRRPKIQLPKRSAWGLGLALFAAVAFEGVMGSQVREMTDTLAKDHVQVARSEWAGELESTGIYLFHRSFSWAVLALGLVFAWASRGAKGDLARASRAVMIGVVLAQMVLGILMAHVSVFPAVQVLHIGLSSVFVASGCWFLLAGREGR
jgi:cytochrome c oxidase assembly protein subunit 15